MATAAVLPAKPAHVRLAGAVKYAVGDVHGNELLLRPPLHAHRDIAVGEGGVDQKPVADGHTL